MTEEDSARFESISNIESVFGGVTETLQMSRLQTTSRQSRLGKSGAPPVTPGEILVGEFLEPLNISQAAFAERIGVSPAYVSDIVRGRRGISPEMALRFEAALGMPAQFWLNAQTACDLYAAKHDRQAIQRRRRIKRFSSAA